MKLEKIRDYDGEVVGYKLGNNKLLKHYYYGNLYGWRIYKNNSEGTKKFNDLVNEGLAETVMSYKEGKKRLVELAG